MNKLSTKPERFVRVTSAAKELGYTTRHIRRLVLKGELNSAGHGAITRASITNYLVKHAERFSDISADMADISLQCPPEPDYKLTVNHLIKRLPPLSEMKLAARTLGIPPRRLSVQMQSGSVPTVNVGSELFIPAHWLAKKLMEAYGVKKAGSR